DVSSNLMLNNGKGEELKKKVNKTREAFLKLLGEQDRNLISTNLIANDDKEKKWEVENFESVPVAAVVTNLTKMQNDCRMLYNDVLNLLYQKTSSKYKPIDMLRAMVVPKKSNILTGETFEADIFLAAYDSKETSEIVIGDKTFTSEG